MGVPLQSAGPGRRPLPEWLREVQCRSKSEIKRLINFYWDFPRDQLEKKLANPTTPMIERHLATLMLEVEDSRFLPRGANWKLFAFLLDRTIGPLPKDDSEGTTRIVTIERASGQQEVTGPQEALIPGNAE